jgi:hypothetical protein
MGGRPGGDVAAEDLLSKQSVAGVNNFGAVVRNRSKCRSSHRVSSK